MLELCAKLGNEFRKGRRILAVKRRFSCGTGKRRLVAIAAVSVRLSWCVEAEVS